MRFKDALDRLMKSQGLNQTQVARLTGINNASLCTYLSGKHEPSPSKKRLIATALGVQENYFEELMPDAEIQETINLPVPAAAKLMGKSPTWVQTGLQQGAFPWGYAVKMKDWSYFISAKKFSEATGIDVPVNQ